MMRIRNLLVATALVVVSIPVLPHTFNVRRTDSGIVQEKWGAFPITYRVNVTRGSNVAGARELADVARSSFQVWSAVSAAQVSFTEGQATTVRDTELDGQNIVTTVPTSFAAGSEALAFAGNFAFTSLGFISQLNREVRFIGEIADSDIVFNPGKNFSTDTTVPADRFDFQAILTHEIGHLLGLDHTGLVNAMMFPSGTTGTRTRTLNSDDITGISTLYPSSAFSTRGTIRGTVRTVAGTPVLGAHVVAVDSLGRPVASAVTGTDGTYTISGLDPGSYTVYAEPLDAPMTPSDLSLSAALSGQRFFTNFTTRFR